MIHSVSTSVYGGLPLWWCSIENHPVHAGGFVLVVFKWNVIFYICFLGIRCRARRLFRPRLTNVIFLGAVITTLHITWKLYHLKTNRMLGICENDIRNFQQQWCRMQRWRIDWEGMVKPCESRVAWTQRQVNSEMRTDARRSFITKWEILPAGEITNYKRLVSCNSSDKYKIIHSTRNEISFSARP